MYSQFTRRLLEKKNSFDFVAAHFECESDKFSEENPNGYVNLGSAQNFLAKQEISDRLSSLDWDLSDTPYREFSGTESCRSAIAGYLQSMAGLPISGKNIVVGNGVISVLEALGIAILDPGDAVLVTTPIFPSLVTALVSRTTAKVLTLETHEEDNFRLTPEILKENLLEQVRVGHKVKAILLCSPGNPIGQVFTAEEVCGFVRVARQFDLALIVDEIYASSCFEGVDFFSALSVDSNNVFVIGGLSKDFGLAGYTTAWVHCANQPILAALKKQAHFFRLAAPVQRAIETFLEPDWQKEFSARNRQRLTQNYHQTRASLKGFGVSVTPAEAGLVCWLDLRSFLKTQDETQQLALYRHLLEQSRVHVSPGSGFHFSQPGFYRICFSQDHETLRQGLRRIQQGLRTFQSICSKDLAEVKQ